MTEEALGESVLPAETKTALDLASVDALYKGFLPFRSWLDQVVVEDRRWRDPTTRIGDLVKSGDTPLYESSLNVMRQIAALETGALEGLYSLDEGVTISLATQATVWHAVLDQQMPARPLIEAQLAAYDYVLDFATGSRPIAEAWIRELHEVICKGQTEYEVYTAPGVKEKRPLKRGSYKNTPNHVALKDGSKHAYSPVEQTGAEMQKLVKELTSEEFSAASPILQAAYTHHAFAAIHPFADGNGRVARALASIFSYRLARVPLLFLAEHRPEYLDTLRQADGGSLQAFTNFVQRIGEATFELVEDSVRAAIVPSPLEAARKAGRIYRTRGGYRHEEVDQHAQSLFNIAAGEFRRVLTEVAEAELSATAKVVEDVVVNPREGYRNVAAVPKQILKCAITSAPPGNSTFNFSVYYFVPVDAGPEDTMIIASQGFPGEFLVRMRELIPVPSIATKARLTLWVNRVLSAAISKTQELAAKSLASKGYR